MNSQPPDNSPLPPPPTLPQSMPQEPPPVLIPSLPDDVALNILCRIPRYHHPKLSIVSKPFRSLLSSPLFFTTRRHVNAIQPCLYLSLRLPTTTTSTSTSTSPAAASLHFFTLHQNPISQKRFLAQVSPPVPGFRSLIGSAFVNVGPKIYIIGGSINDVPSSHVWTLDCRFNVWEQATNMRVGREFAAGGVLEEKIYVIGGCVADNWARSNFWAEVFDTKTGVWECVPSPLDVKEKWMHASAVIDGKVYAMADRGGVKYEPKSDTWDSVEKRLDLGWRGRACVIDGVLYCYDYLGKIRGFDVKDNIWKELSGVDRGLPKFLCGATMANCGGKLVVAWEGKSGGGGSKEVEIWCAEIEVEKSQDGKLLGKIEWVDMVLSVPNGSCIVHCLAVTL